MYRHTLRPVESEVKEALNRGLRALIHHLITSAVCMCVYFHIFPLVYCLFLHVACMFTYMHEFAPLCISFVSSQQTDSIICM